MIKDMDFKGALEDVNDSSFSAETLEAQARSYLPEIKTALKIAGAVQSGEVSDEMLYSAAARPDEKMNTDELFYAPIYRAMSAKLIEGCE